MSATAQVLNVFVASPSDVAEERDAVERVVARVNQRMSPLGWIVRPARWEYARRGLGSPQSRINPYVDECDVLIGIVHRRWGTPTETYSSGFEEEFERVRQRREAGEAVDALLFVRELLNTDQAEDGLVAYRERAYSIAFLHNYRDVDEFERLLFEELVTELARRAGPTPAIAAGDQATLPSGPEPARALIPGDQAILVREAEPGSEAQAASALRELGTAIAGGKDNTEAEIVTRAHLAATAALSASVSGAVLDVHEVNNVYAYRDRLRLTAREQVVIGRTMCEHGLLAPGWRALAGEVTVGNIAALAVTGTTTSIRVGALRELGAAGFRAGAAESSAPLNGIDVLDVYVYLARSDDDQVRAAAAGLLPDSGLAERDLVLALMAARGDIGAHRLLVSELISSDPTAACELVAEAPTWLEPDPEQRLLARARDVGEAGLQALEDAGAQAEHLAWRLRARSGRLDLSRMVDLLSEDNARVRRGAVEALIDAGVAIPPSMIVTALESERDDFPFDFEKRNELALRGLQLHSVEDLMAHVSWLDSQTGIALQAAARREDGTAAIERARRIVSDGFSDERSAAIEREVAASEEPVARRAGIEELVEQFGDFFDSQLLVNALKAMSERPDPDNDAEVARPYSEHVNPFASRAALQIMAACGESRDLPVFVDGLDGAHHDYHGVLVGAALRAADSVDELLDLVVAKTERSERHVPAILRLATSAGGDVSEQRLLALLHDARDDVRIAAVGRLIGLQDCETLERTLVSYADGDHYRYYNVVGILDRVLYAPEEVAAQTRARIARTA